MMTYTASHLTYLLLCHRKLWLHHRQIRMEDNSVDVAAGKLLDRATYQRRAKKWSQLVCDTLKIDHFDPLAKVVKETKKSPKLEHAHVAQLKYYLYALERRGVAGATGLLEYPAQRRTLEVALTEADRSVTIPGWEAEIARIVGLDECPPLVKKSYCGECAFHDFCFV
ncbi:CRISPR-associated protein Cas4 [Neolewinella lacunae]|uniref:CRISPR-associated protein Cas4 n=1 Tax=Neolewinella lacunae TaxID=1517758 RepID=A0A923PLY5_9BACT|nr:CRISPR-associated protein Cas4 [Neolewinella lacunae]MBC6995151.1 CRISPR-associated protein Cas4 [Neolewinella lacunae]MDN3634101.1 CRISPR-associated protein Cas4 [Neolewinella lacunae]